MEKLNSKITSKRGWTFHELIMMETPLTRCCLPCRTDIVKIYLQKGPRYQEQTRESQWMLFLNLGTMDKALYKSLSEGSNLTWTWKKLINRPQTLKILDLTQIKMFQALLNNL